MKNAILWKYYSRWKGYRNLWITLSRWEYHDCWILIIWLYKKSFERHIKDSYWPELEYWIYRDTQDRVIRFHFWNKSKSFYYLQKQLHKNDYYISKIKKLFNS